MAAQYSAELIFKKMSDARISIIIANKETSRYAETADGNRWARSSDEVKQMLSGIKYERKSGYISMSEAANKAMENEYRKEAQRFVVFYRWTYYTASVPVNPWITENAMDKIMEDPLYNYSIVNYRGWYYTNYDNPYPISNPYHDSMVERFESFGGKYINGLTDPNKMAERVSEHIAGFRPDLPEEYTIIKANSLEQLPADFGKIYAWLGKYKKRSSKVRNDRYFGRGAEIYRKLQRLSYLRN